MCSKNNKCTLAEWNLNWWLWYNIYFLIQFWDRPKYDYREWLLQFIKLCDWFCFKKKKIMVYLWQDRVWSPIQLKIKSNTQRWDIILKCKVGISKLNSCLCQGCCLRSVFAGIYCWRNGLKIGTIFSLVGGCYGVSVVR